MFYTFRANDSIEQHQILLAYYASSKCLQMSEKFIQESLIPDYFIPVKGSVSSSFPILFYSTTPFF